MIRLHEEFLWLHETLVENPEYAGYVIPPHPPRPDFDQARERLRKLGDAEGEKREREERRLNVTSCTFA